jgi:PIN domain nuclease of toxin-antitoxin system
MTHLLDTNAWLRLVARPDELSATARALTNQRGILPFGLSAISVWEVTLKARKRKLELLPTTDRWLQSALDRRLVQVVPIRLLDWRTNCPARFTKIPQTDSSQRPRFT